MCRSKFKTPNKYIIVHCAGIKCHLTKLSFGNELLLSYYNFLNTLYFIFYSSDRNRITSN